LAEQRSAASDAQVGLFEVLRKRHACRSFEPKPVPHDLLNKIVYAAHRAPTAGNAAYRFIVVVKDPQVLQQIKLVSPGFFGDCTVAIFVCTDVDLARTCGQQVFEEMTRFDAGAAAENVILAAYALGLAGTFIKSYNEAAVSRILGLPSHCRTDLLVSIGYPAESGEKPLKKKKGAKETYLDKYGQNWSSNLGEKV